MFDHRPLEQARSIRLLALSPGVGTMPLRATLTEVALNKPPPFEALSYCWGNPEPPDAILLRQDGDTGEREPLRITRNCGDALRRLRNAAAPRRLWVDAICIDQTRTEDKNVQVPLMGDIYSAAERVLIWLGRVEGSGRSMRKALKIIRKMPPIATDPFMNDFANSTDQFKKVRMTPKPTRFLLGLITNDYFLRVWTWQEIMVARRITIYFRNQTCDWPKFIDTVAYILMKNRSNWTLGEAIGFSQADRARFEVYSRALQLRLRVKRESPSSPATWSNLAWELPEILPSACKIYHASEPRDKAYGVLFAWPLVSTDEGGILPASFAVDYNKPIRDVYAELTSHLVHRSKVYRWYPLYIVNDADRDPSLPSWVPDWQHNESFVHIQTWIRQMHFNIRSKVYMDPHRETGFSGDDPKPQFHSTDELPSAGNFNPEITSLRLRIRGRILDEVQTVSILPTMTCVDYDPDVVYTADMKMQRRNEYGPDIGNTIVSMLTGDFSQEAARQAAAKDRWLVDQCRMVGFWSQYLMRRDVTQNNLDDIYHTIFADDPSPEERWRRRTKDAGRKLYYYPSPDFRANDFGNFGGWDMEEFRRKHEGSRWSKLSRYGQSNVIQGSLSEAFDNLAHRLTLLHLILAGDRDSHGPPVSDDGWLQRVVGDIAWRYPAAEYTFGDDFAKVDMGKHRIRDVNALTPEEKLLWERYRQCVNFILETDQRTGIESIFFRQCFERKDMAIIRTKDRRLGLAFKGVQVGDQIAYWSGCFTPMIVRSAEEGRQSAAGEDKYWRLHGPAFVHGSMMSVNYGGRSNMTFTVV